MESINSQSSGELANKHLPVIHRNTFLHGPGDALARVSHSSMGTLHKVQYVHVVSPGQQDGVLAKSEPRKEGLISSLHAIDNETWPQKYIRL